MSERTLGSRRGGPGDERKSHPKAARLRGVARRRAAHGPSMPPSTRDSRHESVAAGRP